MEFRKHILAPAWRYAHIVGFKTYANLKGEYEKTFLGCLWWALEPIINTAIFYVVFVYIMHNRTPNFVVFLYVGMVSYGWFAGGINMAANSVVAHAGLMQQVRLPKVLFPIIAVSNISWKFLFSLAVLFPLLWWHHTPITWAYLALPVLLLLQYVAIIAIGMPLASFIPYFPDARTVIGSFFSAFIWLCGVFYGRERIPGAVQPLFYSNPIAALIEAYRAILLEGRWPAWSHLIPTVFISLVCLGAGLLLFRYIDRKVTKIPL